MYNCDDDERFPGQPNKMCLIYRFKGIVEVHRGSSHSSGSGVEWSVHLLDGNREVFLFHLILGSPRVSVEVEVASSNCHNNTTEWQGGSINGQGTKV